MSVLNARDVAAKQPGALFDVALRKIFVSRSSRIRSPIIMAGIVTWTSVTSQEQNGKWTGLFGVTEDQWRTSQRLWQQQCSGACAPYRSAVRRSGTTASWCGWLRAERRSAFEELVRRHQQRVCALVGGILRRAEDVEDVAQQVFLKVYLVAQEIRSTRGVFHVALQNCRERVLGLFEEEKSAAPGL